MIKELKQASNLYLHINRLERVNKVLKQLNKQGIFLTSNLKDPSSFFGSLHEFQMKYKTNDRVKRRDIEAIQVDVLLPKRIDHDLLIGFARNYAKKAFKNLPYTCYQFNKGQGSYLIYIVSERKYLKKSVEVSVCAKSDVYQKINSKGKKVFTTASDPAGNQIKKKGDVYKKYKTHFTNKDRLFTGNDNEFTHKVLNFKRVAVSLFSELNFVIKRVFFQKINIKKAKGNYFHYLNIRDLNDTFMYFEKTLNAAEHWILQGYMEEELKYLNKIKYRFLNRARDMRFQYGRVSLPFDYRLRRDRFRENIESLVSAFDVEIDQFYEELKSYI